MICQDVLPDSSHRNVILLLRLKEANIYQDMNSDISTILGVLSLAGVLKEKEKVGLGGLGVVRTSQIM